MTTVSVMTSSSTRGRRGSYSVGIARRQKIVAAATERFAREGYHRTALTRVAEDVGITEGGLLHHFPSKDALIAAAAEQLIRRIYIQLGHTIRHVGESEDRLAEIIMSAWRTVFGTRENAVMQEPMLASRHDPVLAEAMFKLWTAGYGTIGLAAEHYFEGLRPEELNAANDD